MELGARFIKRNWPYVTLGIILLALYGIFSDNPYILYVLTLVMMYALMSTGVGIFTGWAGILIFCPSALAVIGAYTSSLLVMHTPIPFLLALILAALASAAVGVAISYAAIVIRQEMEILVVTFSFEIVVYYLLGNWKAVGGFLGLTGIPYATIGPIMLDSVQSLYIFSVIVLMIVLVLVVWFYRSRLGLLIRAVHEDEGLAEAVGHNTATLKVIATAAGAACCGIGGVLYAFSLHAVSPGAFTLSNSVILVLIALLGGMAIPLGPIVGAFFVIGIPETLHFLGDLRLIIFYAVLIVVVLFSPRGIVGTIWKRGY